MCLYEFDVELHERVLREEEREEGRLEGRTEGKREERTLAKQVFKAFLSGKSSEEIARGLNIPVEEVEDLVM